MKQSTSNPPVNEDGIRFLAKSINGKIISELRISIFQGDSIFGLLHDAYSGRDWEEIPIIILNHAQMDGWWEADKPTEISESDLEIFLKLLKELKDKGCHSRSSVLKPDDLVLCAKEVYEFLTDNHSSNAKLFIQSI